jgi:hypothetical protein
MQLDANERLEIFPQLAPDNCAALLQEQAVRWRAVHADALTPAQQQVLAEAIALIRPEQFARPSRRRSGDEVKAFLALEARVSMAFTLDEAAEAFTLQGRALPPAQ